MCAYKLRLILYDVFIIIVCVLQVCSRTQTTVLCWWPVQLSDVEPAHLPQDAPCKPPLLVCTHTHIYPGDPGESLKLLHFR